MTHATPRPWKVTLGDLITGVDGYRVADCENTPYPERPCGSRPVDIANAALIVQACNAHDQLVDALKGCLQALRHAPIEGAFGKDARYKAEQVLREIGHDAL